MQGPECSKLAGALSLSRERPKRAWVGLFVPGSILTALGLGFVGLSLITPALESIELREALASLSRREKQLLWLVYAEGFSHREVARIMKLSQASVRVLTFRARKKLKRVLVPGEDTSS